MGTSSAKRFTAKTGEPFIIRSARPEDALALIALRQAVTTESDYMLTEPDECGSDEEQQRQWIQEHLDGPGKLCLLAEASGALIGSLGCENGHRRRIAHRGMFGMAVRQGWRNRGVGSALLQCFLDWAASNPIIEKVNLNVFAVNSDAIRLYKRFGFVEEGRQPREIKVEDQYVDLILMYRFV